MKFLLLIDQSCFRFINQNLSNPFCDLIMPVFDDPKYFVLLILLLWVYLLINDKDNRWKLAFLIPIVVILTDQTGLMIKKTVLRPRPWAALDQDLILLLVGEKGLNYSFPSNHAANVSGLAVIFSSTYQRYKIGIWSLAGIVMFSRIYIGVHYPGDVLGGWLLGSGIGFILVTGMGYYQNKNSPLM